MMQPYYDHGGITIYHGDCREVLPTLEPENIDLVLTDPPYPRIKGGTKHSLPGLLAPRKRDSLAVGQPWDSSLDWAPLAEAVCRFGLVVFCSFAGIDLVANAFASERIGLAAWYKRNAPPAINNVPHYDLEFAWLLKKRPGMKWRSLKSLLIDWPMIPNGCIPGDEPHFDHPTQKPLPVMARLIPEDCRSLVDPFMGTGTALCAAKQANSRAIGIEIEERYCEIAARRLAQEMLPLGQEG
jgi:site-specific DNA-methyltransferase (adenine-specific)